MKPPKRDKRFKEGVPAFYPTATRPTKNTHHDMLQPRAEIMAQIDNDFREASKQVYAHWIKFGKQTDITAARFAYTNEYVLALCRVYEAWVKAEGVPEGGVPVEGIEHREPMPDSPKPSKAGFSQVPLAVTKSMYQMRLAGYSYEEIADAFHTNMWQVHEYIHKQVQENQTQVDMFRAISLDLDMSRLDALLRTHWVKAVEESDPDSTKMVLSILERRAKMLGYDAPTRSESTSLTVSAQVQSGQLDLTKLSVEELKQLYILQQKAAAAQPTAALPAGPEKVVSSVKPMVSDKAQVSDKAGGDPAEKSKGDPGKKAPSDPGKKQETIAEVIPIQSQVDSLE